ncbi:MAG: cupin domain-containing protein [Pseudomonadota bacterium]|nr:cupin domain-containing protein [Pseudomonadota bacterium]
MSEFFNTGLSQQAFLDQYWQKKPLLIRQAFPDFESPITPDELAGFACQDDIESRLIEEHTNSGPWKCRHGPFSEDDFSELPESHWTLLVQDMDKHEPVLADITRQFSFIPEWRRDDLMISYAPVGGSVGPHTDGYDVFLLQAKGTRRWQIGAEPILDTDLIDGLDLKILAEFNADESWDLEPGDMLYLPPHFAHHGVAMNDCMTFSIGFRAPTQTEVLDAYLQELAESVFGERHYSDPDLRLNVSETQIDGAAIARFKQSLIDTINHSDALLQSALGRLVTQTKPSLEWLADEYHTDDNTLSISAQFEAGVELQRNPYIRLAWTAAEQNIFLFVAGEKLVVDPSYKAVVDILTGSSAIKGEQWRLLQQHEGAERVLSSLVEQGAWYWVSR